MEVPAEETQVGSGRVPIVVLSPGCILEPPGKLNICCLGPTPGHTDSAGLECRRALGSNIPQEVSMCCQESERAGRRAST